MLAQPPIFLGLAIKYASLLCLMFDVVQKINCKPMFEILAYLLIIGAPISRHLSGIIHFHSIKIKEYMIH